MDTPLFNLSPTLSLIGITLLLVSLVLGYFWFQNKKVSRGKKVRHFLLLLIFLTFDLILFGAYTRLSDSGLGCPDWPGCYGKATVWQAQAQVSAAEAAMPTGPVTTYKAWVEMIHRHFAMLIGALILALTVLRWYWHKHHKMGHWLSTFTLFWVCVQGAFGAYTVTLKLTPWVVTLHLLGGMFLLALLQMQYTQWLIHRRPQRVLFLHNTTRTWLGIAMVVLVIQMALGAWLSSNYAVQACPDFPLCQGQLIPPMQMREALDIAHALGKLSDGNNMSFQGLTAIHWLHRFFALIFMAVFVYLALRLYRVSATRSYAYGIFALLGVQVLTGATNALLKGSIFFALMHTAGAALYVLLLVRLTFVSKTAYNTPSASNFSASNLQSRLG